MVDAFLGSMEMDITVSQYETEKDLLGYLYGSSEVVGLMMARILRLPERADHAARLLGRAMQYINFIRDIPEDLTLGRLYFPVQELNQFGLASSMRPIYGAILRHSTHSCKDRLGGMRYGRKRQSGGSHQFQPALLFR